MKYFSSECVANAYKGFQGSVTNKSWGVLAIMRQIDSMIIPGRTYVVNCSSLSTYIEQLFCLGSKKSYIDNGKEWFVKFSTQWNDFFDNQGQTIPNIYDIIVWAYRTSPLPDDITHEKLLAMFAEDFHLSVTDIQNTFETREKRIEYTNYLYTDSNLLSLVSGKLGTSLSKNITADGKSVAASPGELSRGPFIQPLYAALDTADYILVSQTNFDELYPMKACRNPIVTSINNDCFNHYLASIKTKPFLILGGFSGTGKSQKVKELAFLTCPNDDEFSKKLGNTKNTPGNYCLVSVRPNWHDSTDLLGYYSSINDKYIVTDFVKFLVKAMQYPKIPFFVCLDEMNLAPVEEYFAEFLSVLESRKKVGDKILTDPLLSADWFNKKYKNYNIFDDIGLKRIGQEQSKGENRQASLFGVIDEAPFDRMDIVERLMENGLCLPQNVVVIGTVNMDDTTNSFSRKVIDRAMTFETVVEEFDNTYYTKEASAFGEKIFKTMRAVADDFIKEYDCDYQINTEQIPGESAAAKLMKKDKFFYPRANIYDLPLYGNQFIPLGIKTTLQERIRIAAEFDGYCNGGSILHANIDAPFDSFEKAWKMVEYIADQHLTYFAFNTKIQCCENNHAFYGTVCPCCGKPVDSEYTRIVGFYTKIKTWSNERTQEYKLRKWESINNNEVVA